MAFDAREHNSREDLMSAPDENFPEPVPLPAGHYYGQIVRNENGNVGEKETPVLDYWVQLTEPGEDVDPSDIEGDIRDYERRVRFFITPKAMWRLVAFHRSLGKPESVLNDAFVPETTGMRVLLTLSNQTNRTSKRKYDQVDEAVGAPEA